jgi:hypothetical protein
VRIIEDGAAMESEEAIKHYELVLCSITYLHLIYG